jgi:transcriptional regulator with XRE-family HTH domain
VAEQSPSRVRRAVGDELRIMRDLAGLTQRQIGAAARVGQVGASRIERGLQLPSRGQVEAWALACQASDDVTRRAVALLEAAHGETRPWPDLGARVGGLQAVASAREEDASLVRDCALTWLPGLVQTAEYTRLLIPQVDVAGSIDHAAAVAARMERQQILYRGGREFRFLVGEEALRWSPGAASVMVGQRAQLATVATLSNVEVRVLTLSRAGVPAWHNFTLFDPADGGDPFVTTELLHGGQEVHGAEAVALYDDLWSRLWEAALHGEEAMDAIRRI